MNIRKLPWKKNFRRIPEWITRKVGESANDELIISAVKKISASEISQGKYAHLGINMEGQAFSSPARILPPADVGRFSNWNINGRVIVRRDLPKVLKSFGPYSAPNFGDASRGYHDVTFSRPVFQRDTLTGGRSEIRIDLLQQEQGTGDFIVRFQVDSNLNRAATGFVDALMSAINLLQENVGLVDVFPADATDAQFMGTVSVNWEVLPPGEDARQKILGSFSGSTAEIRANLMSRFELLSSLSPMNFINGTSGFTRYFGAQFSDRLVVFENLEYGNAAYAMNEDWQQFSKRSRLDLLAERPQGVTRLIHTSSFADRLTQLVTEQR